MPAACLLYCARSLCQETVTCKPGCSPPASIPCQWLCPVVPAVRHPLLVALVLLVLLCRRCCSSSADQQLRKIILQWYLAPAMDQVAVKQMLLLTLLSGHTAQGPDPKQIPSKKMLRTFVLYMTSSMLQDFRQNPERLCAHLPPVVLEDPATRVHYSIQDTPGYKPLP